MCAWQNLGAVDLELALEVCEGGGTPLDGTDPTAPYRVLFASQSARVVGGPHQGNRVHLTGFREVLGGVQGCGLLPEGLEVCLPLDHLEVRI